MQQPDEDDKWRVPPPRDTQDIPFGPEPEKEVPLIFKILVGFLVGALIVGLIVPLIFGASAALWRWVL